MMCSDQCPAGTPTRPATRYFFRYPTRSSFGNYRVAGNPKRRVLLDISGKPEVSGTTRYFGYHPEKENNTIIRCSSLGPTKRSPGCKKSAKSSSVTSSITVEFLSVGQSLLNQSITFISAEGAHRRLWPMINIPSHPIWHITMNELNRPKIDLSRPSIT